VRPIAEKLALLFVLAAIVLNFPVLAVFNRHAAVGGVPVLYLYLFGVWAAAILAVIVLTRHPWDGEG
jgi:hypothetical protein